MEVVEDEGVKSLIRDELSRLGINGSPTVDLKRLGYGAKFLNKTVQGGISKSGKNKKKLQVDTFKDSPLHSLRSEGKKNAPKSPFTSSKNRCSTKKKNHQQLQLQQNAKVFGRPLHDCLRTSAVLPDANTVQVPAFLVDACNLLRKHIILEGLFRKAGSAARQNDLKRLMDSGESLPSHAHPVDVACLVKQFFRCLPQPLLETATHTRMLRCHTGLDDSDARLSGLMLCTLLLSAPSQHTLVYFLNFLSEVVQHSSSNRMDAYNLSVVLSPSLLPLSVPSLVASTSSAKKGAKLQYSGLSLSEDSILAANIDIMQDLITHQCRVCRLPRDVLAGLLAERSTQQAGGQDATDGGGGGTGVVVNKNKKRRSASIHRLMSGLRRVVGGQSGGGTNPPHHHPNPNSPHPHQHHRITQPSPVTSLLLSSPSLLSPSTTPGGAGGVSRHPYGLSLHPMPGGGGASVSAEAVRSPPGERKSDVLLPDVVGAHDHPSKRARIATEDFMATISRPKSYAAAVATTPKSEAEAGSKNSKVRRSHTTREVATQGGGTAALPRYPSLAACLAQAVQVPVPVRGKKKSPRGSLNTHLSGRLADLGDKWRRAEVGHKKASLTLYPYQSVEVTAPVECLVSAVIHETSVAGEEGDLDGPRDEEGVSTPMGSGLGLAKELGNHLSVVQCRPLHKCQSEVISKSNGSQTPRTPLKASKTHANLQLQSAVTPTVSQLLCTPSSAAGGSVHGTPALQDSASLTPRNGVARNSKRARRKARNARLALLSGEPDGESCSSPSASRRGSRGAPDGAESTLRETTTPSLVMMKASGESDLQNLEEQYTTIKSAVANMEIDVDLDSLKDMRKSSMFGEEISSLVTLNHNEIIQSAYDRMKKESSVLGLSPSESLSRRLDKELKIRRRKSGEGRVIRSPSERKIGTIRRRSRELELKLTKSNVTDDGTSASKCLLMTPKFKGSLVKSPLSHSLKRGRPNSVKCGLPVLARPNVAQESPSVTKPRKESPRTPVSVSSNSSFIISQAIQPSTKEIINSTVSSSNNVSCNNTESVSSINSMSSMESSPGNMDDHFMPRLNPGVITDCFASSTEFEDEHWVTASDFFDHVTEDEIKLDCKETKGTKEGNRPSIAALKKQKKVTANVQLFNQLGTDDTGRRQQCVTPSSAASLYRPTASERRPQHRALQYRHRPQQHRATLTPRQMSRAAANHNIATVAAAMAMRQPFARDESRPKPKVAIVSPLKENWANSALPPCTPKRTNATKDYPSNDGVFKTPGPPPPLTPLHSRQSRPLKIPASTLPTTMISSDIFL